MEREFPSEIIQGRKLAVRVLTPFWKESLASVAGGTTEKTYKPVEIIQQPNRGFSVDALDFIVESHQAPLQVLFLDLTQKTFFKA